MRRLVSCLGIAACALALTAANAAAELEVDFKLPASHGLRAEIQADEEEVALVILDADHPSRAFRYTAYLVEGEVGETGVEADFGRLGHVSMRFEETERTPFERVGSFSGEAVFRGEGGYVTIDARRAKGTVSGEAARRWLGGLGALPLARGADDVGALRARDGAGRYFLATGETDAHGKRSGNFVASFVQHREGIRIIRVAVAADRRGRRFAFDHEAGTATVRAPAPFSGHASFRRHGKATGPGTWRGNLTVSLLGHDPIRLAGPSFRASLNRHPPVDE